MNVLTSGEAISYQPSANSVRNAFFTSSVDRERSYKWQNFKFRACNRPCRPTEMPVEAVVKHPLNLNSSPHPYKL
jgi:hypothetical protein